MDNVDPSEMSNLALLLRFFGLFLAVGAIICASVADSYLNGDWIYDVVLGVAGFWSLINVILIVSKHPIHPGFHIALDIVLTFALWLFGFLGLHASTGGTWTGTSHYGAITASAFMTVDGIVHLTIFVLACHNVHRRCHRASSGT